MFAVGKSALGVLDAYWLSAARYVPGALVMLVILWAIEGRRAMSPGAAAMRLWLFGSLGFAGFSILAFLGIAQSRPEHAAIIVALMPLITSMMNWFVRGRRPSALTLGATAVALAGVLLVLTHGELHRAADIAARTLELLDGLVPRPLLTSNITSATLFRTAFQMPGRQYALR